MQAEVAGRKLIMVFLDSAGKFSRLGDAERVRNWVESARAFGAPKMTPKRKPRLIAGAFEAQGIEGALGFAISGARCAAGRVSQCQ